MPTTARDVARRRIATQLLTGPPAGSPVEVVRHLTAVQSQELGPARWSVGRRCGADDAEVVAALDRGDILRTHVLRPTWHFVAADDLHWLQDLTAGRVRQQERGNARRAGVDDELVAACVAVFEQALPGRALTRAELGQAVAAAGIGLSNHQLGHVTLRAELDGVLTSGPLRGTVATFALLDERAPRTRRLDEDEALAELAGRYVSGHGPASVKDLAWWAGLTLTQARRGIAAAGHLERVVVDGVDCWLDPASPAAAPSGALMVPTFDECLVAFTETRRFAYVAEPDRPTNPNTFAQPVLVDGQVVGTWRRGTAKEPGVMRLSVADEHLDLLEPELARYAAHLGVEDFDVVRT